VTEVIADRAGIAMTAGRVATVAIAGHVVTARAVATTTAPRLNSLPRS